MYFYLGFLPFILPEFWAASKFKNIKDSEVFNSILPEFYEKYWLTPVVKQIVYNIKPTGVTIWNIDGAELDRRLSNFIVQSFSRRLPTLQIDVLEMNKTKISECLPSLPQVGNPIATINVVLMMQTDNELIFEKKLKSLFKNIIIEDMESYSQNPKILIVIYGTGHTNRQIEYSLEFCFWARRRKILDLTFMYIKKNWTKRPIVAYIEPFGKRLFALRFHKSVDIFPHKLKNMKNTTVRISMGVYSEEDIKYQEKIRKKFTYRMQMEPGDYVFLKYYFCAVHNCTVRIGDNKSNFRLGNFLLHYAGYQSCLGLCTKFVDITAAIPQLDAKSVVQYKYSNMACFYLLMILFILLLKFYVKLTSLKKSDWTVADIFLCILGSGVEFQKSLRASLFYLVLLSLSFYISNDLIDVATDFELDEKRIVVDDLEALDQMNVPIYSRFDAPYLFGNHKSLMSKHVGMGDFEIQLIECIKNLRTYNDRICVDIDFYIQTTNAKVAESDGRDLGLRKIDFVIQRQCSVAIFEAHSPYREMYDLLTLKALDHGLLRRPTTKEYLNSQGLEYDERDCNLVPNNSADFYWSLFHVTAFFYGLAIVTFLTEIFSDRHKTAIKRFGKYDYKKRCPRPCAKITRSRLKNINKVIE